MYFIEISIIIFLGLVLGSFSTALIYRVPRKLPWGGDRSACPACKATLGALDLIPVMSWCFSMGKCRHCSNKISCKYPIIELITVVLCLAIYFVLGLSEQSLFIIIIIPILVSLFVIDLEHMILPNQLVLIVFIIGICRLVYLYMLGEEVSLLMNYVGGAFIYAFTSWSLGFVLTKIMKRDSLGFGDVKFFLVAGLWLGLSILPYFMILSGSLAILFAICWRMITKNEVFPLGPALIMSLYILLLLF